MAERKRTSEVDWEDVRYFGRLADLGSLSATARSFGVNHATVARHVASLEQSLAVALFDRRSDGYHLTAEGRELLDEARAMATAADAIVDRIGGGSRTAGPVRITATELIAAHLVPSLAGLASTHPGIDLEIIVDSRLLSLARREADIAVRIGHPKDSDLLCRRLGDLKFGFFANADWAERVRSGSAPEFVGFDTDTATRVAEAQWLAERFPSARVPFRISGHLAQAAAARAGFGIALLPCFLADKNPDLVRIDLGALPADRPLWLIIRPELARQPRFRVVTEAIVALFRDF